MSDGDDAMSEVAPEGWSLTFNQMNLGSPVAASPKLENGKSEKSEVAPSVAAWFGGWFGTPTNAAIDSKVSSISSDTPPVVESGGNSDAEDSHVDGRTMMNEDDDKSSDRGSNVDSDGFPREDATEVEKALRATSVEGDDSVSSPGSVKSQESVAEQVSPEPVRSVSRRERLQNRQQFQLIPHPAADLVATEGVEEASWWGALFPKQQHEEQEKQEKQEKQADKPVIPAPPEQELPPEIPVVPTEESTEGVWSRLFGKPIAEPLVAPRALLPEIALPPAVRQDVNSYFPAVQPAIEILGPGRVFGKFQGKVRGWPRRLAPYWSSETSQLPPPSSFSRPPSGASALAMFRVT